MNKKNQIENAVRMKDFDNLMKLWWTDDDKFARTILELFYYYLIRIQPSYKYLFYGCRECECESSYKSNYWWFLFHMSRLCICVESGEYVEALNEIEDLYYAKGLSCVNKKVNFFQPKIVYNIVEILSRLEGKGCMLMNEKDEFDFETQIDMINRCMKEFRYVKKRKRFIMDDSGVALCRENSFKYDIYSNKIKVKYRTSRDAIGEMIKYAGERGCDINVVIEYLMNIIKNDLKYDCLAEIIYRSEQSGFCVSFPHRYHDEAGEHILCEEKEKVEIDFSKTCVISVPWNKHGLVNNLQKFLSEEFRYHEGNHMSVYYPQVDLCFATNGNHTIAMGINNNQGKIMADVFDLQPLFGKVYSDGMNWYSVYNNRKICKTTDFRIGLLFELAQIRYNIEKG